MSHNFNGSFTLQYGCFMVITLSSAKEWPITRSHQGEVSKKKRGKREHLFLSFLSIWYWLSIRLLSNIVKYDDISFSLVNEGNAILLFIVSLVFCSKCCKFHEIIHIPCIKTDFSVFVIRYLISLQPL